jgi:uncharacterized protein with NAD-binding domain and iron-sulfur cluster
VKEMNATEARKISNENLPKLVEANVLAIQTMVNQQIKSAAKNGEFSTRLPISVPFLIQNDVLEQLVSHYKNSGYKVQIHNLFISRMFQVSWEQ